MASQSDQDFLKLALEKGYVTQDQVLECLEAQRVAESVGMSDSIDAVMLKKNVLSQSRVKELKLAMTQSVGKEVIPGYSVISKLGQGGMGAVYKARQLSMDRIVAIKILPKNLAKNKEFCDRFLREARLVAKFNHPNIIGAFDAGEASGLHYFVMEFVDGETCSDLMKRESPLSENRVVEIALQTLKALEFAHNKNIIHRDIKPENIMLSKQGVVKVADLGLARSTQEDSSLTATGAAFGTPLYISPEQAKGEKNLDGRTDLYSFGATLYHMLSGKPPYSGDTAAVVMTKHITEPVPDLKKLRPDLSDGLCAIIKKLMSKNPAERFQNAADAAEALRNRQNFTVSVPVASRVSASTPTSAPVPVAALAPKRAEKISAPSRERVSSRASGKSFPVGLVVAFLLLAAIGTVAGIMFFSKSEDENTQAKLTPTETPKAVETARPTPKIEESEEQIPIPANTPPKVESKVENAEEIQAEIKNIRQDLDGETPNFKELYQRLVKVKKQAQDTKFEDNIDKLLTKLFDLRKKTAKKTLASLKEEADKLAGKNKYQAAINKMKDFPSGLEDAPEFKEAAEIADALKKRAGEIYDQAVNDAEKKAGAEKFKEAAAVLEPFREWDLDEIREQAQNMQRKFIGKEEELRLQKEEQQRTAVIQKYWDAFRSSAQAAKEHKYDKALSTVSALKNTGGATVSAWVEADTKLFEKQKEMWGYFEKNIDKAVGVQVLKTATIRGASSLDKITIGGGNAGEDITYSYKALPLEDRCVLLKEVLDKFGDYSKSDVLMMRFITALDEKKSPELIEKIAIEAEVLRNNGTLDKHYAEAIETLLGGEKEQQAQTAFATLEQLARDKSLATLEKKLSDFDERYGSTKFAKNNQAGLDKIRRMVEEISGAVGKIKKALNCSKVEKIGDNRYRLTYDFSNSAQLGDFLYSKGRWRASNGELQNPPRRDSNNLSQMAHILRISPRFKISIDDFQKESNDGIVLGFGNICVGFGAKNNVGTVVLNMEEQDGRRKGNVLAENKLMILPSGRTHVEMEYNNGTLTATIGQQKLVYNAQLFGDNNLWLIAGFNNRVHRFDNLVIECEPDQRNLDQLIDLDKFVNKAAQDARITVNRGLVASYYKSVGFKNLLAKRLDANFDYPIDRPVDNIGDAYSVVWEGYLFIPRDDEYQFVAQHDDDVIIIFDGNDRNEIKGYTPLGQPPHKISKKLTAGLHKLKVEHWDQGGLGFLIMRMTDSSGNILPLDLFLYHEPSQAKNLDEKW